MRGLQVDSAPIKLALLCFLLGLSQFPSAARGGGSTRVEVEAQRLEYDAASQTFFALAGESQKVEVKADGLLLTCGTLSLTVDKDGGQLRQLAAAGGVQMKQTLDREPKQQVECSAQSLTYSPESGVVSAAGGVEAQLTPPSASGGLESVSAERLVLQRGGDAATATGKAMARLARPAPDGGQAAVAVLKGHQLRYQAEQARIEATGGPSAPWAHIEYFDPTTARKIVGRSLSALLVQRGEEGISLEGEGELTSSGPSGELLWVRADKIEYSPPGGQALASGGAQAAWNSGSEEAGGPIRLSCGADSMVYVERDRRLSLSGRASALVEDLSQPDRRQMIRRADAVSLDLVRREGTASGEVAIEFSFPRQEGKGLELSLMGDSVVFRSEEGDFEANGRPVSVAGENFTLTCVQVKGSLEADGSLKTLSALGGISFAGKTKTQRLEGAAEQAVYSPAEQAITAKGKVSGVLSPLSGGEGPSRWEDAEMAVFHLDTGDIQVTGERVKMSFPIPEK